MQNQINKNNKITISFTKFDSDLIDYLEELKKVNKASEFIRDAIREKIEKREAGIETNEEIMRELEKITKRINSLEKGKDSYSDNLVVSKEDRFGSPKTIEVSIASKTEEEKLSKDEELDEVLGFFDF